MLHTLLLNHWLLTIDCIYAYYSTQCVSSNDFKVLISNTEIRTGSQAFSSIYTEDSSVEYVSKLFFNLIGMRPLKIFFF